MAPEQNAKHIFKKFYNELNNLYSTQVSLAKRCSKVCCDILIEKSSSAQDVAHWQHVKHEIDKIDR